MLRYINAPYSIYETIPHAYNLFRVTLYYRLTYLLLNINILLFRSWLSLYCQKLIVHLMLVTYSGFAFFLQRAYVFTDKYFFDMNISFDMTNFEANTTISYNVDIEFVLHSIAS